MPSPFPGMDPFIESQSWPNFHSRLINGIADTLPQISVPLAEGDPEVILDLQAAYELTYRRGGFPRFLRYQEPVSPRCTDADAEWVASRLAEWQR